MTAHYEKKMVNAVHSIARVSGIADEQFIRDAIEKLVDEWGIDIDIVLERLYYFLADGQEQRFIVKTFREYVEREQESLLEDFRIEIQSGPGMA